MYLKLNYQYSFSETGGSAQYYEFRSEFTERRRERVFSPRKSLDTCRGTVQIECEHKFARVKALIAPRAIFSRKTSGFFAINQSSTTSLVSVPQIETGTPDRFQKMDRTESMILEIENNNVLYDKADTNYKDITKTRHMESNWKERREDR